MSQLTGSVSHQQNTCEGCIAEMINDVLTLLKNRLNGYIRAKTGVAQDQVEWIPGAKLEPLSFPIDVITPLLINVEEDRTVRLPNQFEGVVKNGMRTQVNPVIHINLIVLFVCKFDHYDQGLKFLDYVIRFFQSHRQLNHQNAPDLDPTISKLIVELLSMPLVQQNELWNALRTSYIPSVAYRIRMLVYRDDEAIEFVEEVRETTVDQRPVTTSGVDWSKLGSTT